MLSIVDLCVGSPKMAILEVRFYYGIFSFRRCLSTAEFQLCSASCETARTCLTMRSADGEYSGPFFRICTTGLTNGCTLDPQSATLIGSLTAQVRERNASHIQIAEPVSGSTFAGRKAAADLARRRALPSWMHVRDQQVSRAPTPNSKCT